MPENETESWWLYQLPESEARLGVPRTVGAVLSSLIVRV